MINIEHYKKHAPSILRIGISLVFIWFGVSQLINPGNFLGYVPGWSLNIMSPLLTIMLNSIYEIIFGILMLLGLFTRLSALLLSIKLLIIILPTGYNDIAVRDFGLLISAVSVVLNGPDQLSIDSRRR